MEFCKNKRTGKYFVYIEDRPDGKFLLVTPRAEIKSLDPSLFDEPDEQNPDDLLSRGLLNEQQLRRYHKFIEKDSVSILLREMEAEKEPLEALEVARQKMSLRQWDYVMEVMEKISSRLTSDQGKDL